MSTTRTQQPVAYQYRMRPAWDDRRNWSEWDACSKGAHEDYLRVPRLHDWLYETRALYAAPQPAAAPQAEPECDRCGEPVSRHTSSHWCDNQSFEMPRGLHAAPQPAGEALTDGQITHLIEAAGIPVSDPAQAFALVRLGAARIAKLQAENTDMRKVIDQCNAELLECMRAMEQVGKQRDELQAELGRANDLIAALEQTRCLENKDRDRLKAEVERLRAYCDAHRALVAAQNAMLAASDANIGGHRNPASVRGELDRIAVEARNAELRAAADAARDALAAAKARFDAARDALSA